MTYRHDPALVECDAVERVGAELTQSFYCGSLHLLTAVVEEVHERRHSPEASKLKAVLAPVAAVRDSRG